MSNEPAALARPLLARRAISLRVFAKAILIRLGESLWIDFVQDFEVSDFCFDDFLAVMFDLDLRGLLDAVDIFITPVARLLGDFLVHPIHHLADEPDRQAAFLIEE